MAGPISAAAAAACGLDERPKTGEHSAPISTITVRTGEAAKLLISALRAAKAELNADHVDDVVLELKTANAFNFPPAVAALMNFYKKGRRTILIREPNVDGKLLEKNLDLVLDEHLSGVAPHVKGLTLQRLKLDMRDACVINVASRLSAAQPLCGPPLQGITHSSGAAISMQEFSNKLERLQLHHVFIPSPNLIKVDWPADVHLQQGASLPGQLYAHQNNKSSARESSLTEFKELFWFENGPPDGPFLQSQPAKIFKHLDDERYFYQLLEARSEGVGPEARMIVGVSDKAKRVVGFPLLHQQQFPTKAGDDSIRADLATRCEQLFPALGRDVTVSIYELPAPTHDIGPDGEPCYYVLPWARDSWATMSPPQFDPAAGAADFEQRRKEYRDALQEYKKQLNTLARLAVTTESLTSGAAFASPENRDDHQTPWCLVVPRAFAEEHKLPAAPTPAPSITVVMHVVMVIRFHTVDDAPPFVLSRDTNAPQVAVLLPTPDSNSSTSCESIVSWHLSLPAAWAYNRFRLHPERLWSFWHNEAYTVAAVLRADGKLLVRRGRGLRLKPLETLDDLLKLTLSMALIVAVDAAAAPEARATLHRILSLPNDFGKPWLHVALVGTTGPHLDALLTAAVSMKTAAEDALSLDDNPATIVVEAQLVPCPELDGLVSGSGTIPPPPPPPSSMNLHGTSLPQSCEGLHEQGFQVINFGRAFGQSVAQDAAKLRAFVNCATPLPQDQLQFVPRRADVANVVEYVLKCSAGGPWVVHAVQCFAEGGVTTALQQAALVLCTERWVLFVHSMSTQGALLEACEKLVAAHSADIVLFCDAEVVHSSQAAKGLASEVYRRARPHRVIVVHVTRWWPGAKQSVARVNLVLSPFVEPGMERQHISTFLTRTMLEGDRQNSALQNICERRGRVHLLELVACVGAGGTGAVVKQLEPAMLELAGMVAALCYCAHYVNKRLSVIVEPEEMRALCSLGDAMLRCSTDSSAVSMRPFGALCVLRAVGASPDRPRDACVFLDCVIRGLLLLVASGQWAAVRTLTSGRLPMYILAQVRPIEGGGHFTLSRAEKDLVHTKLGVVQKFLEDEITRRERVRRLDKKGLHRIMCTRMGISNLQSKMERLIATPAARGRDRDAVNRESAEVCLKYAEEAMQHFSGRAARYTLAAAHLQVALHAQDSEQRQRYLELGFQQLKELVAQTENQFAQQKLVRQARSWVDRLGGWDKIRGVDLTFVPNASSPSTRPSGVLDDDADPEFDMYLDTEDQPLVAPANDEDWYDDDEEEFKEEELVAPVDGTDDVNEVQGKAAAIEAGAAPQIRGKKVADDRSRVQELPSITNDCIDVQLEEVLSDWEPSTGCAAAAESDGASSANLTPAQADDFRLVETKKSKKLARSKRDAKA